MNNETKNVTAPVDVLAVMERDDNDARKHRIADRHSYPMGARINAALESEDARAAVAELVEAANDYANADAPASIMDERRQRLRAALAKIVANK